MKNTEYFKTVIGHGIFFVDVGYIALHEGCIEGGQEYYFIMIII